MTGDAAPQLLLRAAMNGMPAAVIIFNDQLRIVFASDAVAVVLGASIAAGNAQLGALSVFLAACPKLGAESAAKIVEAARAAIEAGDAVRPAFPIICAGSRHTIAIEVSAAGPRHWTMVCRDVAQEQSAERRAIDLASRDPLTGLANRALFAEHVAQVCRSEASASAWMMLVDLDRFKAVNDTLGHLMGDALLKVVARRLSSALRDTDFVARFGGDEFGLLIRSCTGVEAAAKLGKRLIDVIGRPYLIDGHLLHVGASLGIGATLGVENYEQLFKRADLALYAAKAAGRNTFCFFEPAMDARALERRALEIDLRKAIALREFELHYQPQIDLERSVIVGFEALIRWRHPTRGLVPPGAFIPLAEEIGLIVSMGEWVLREACREAARWPETISIAVNVSPLQFENPSALIVAVDKALRANGLPGHRLEIEITESVLLRSEGAVLEALHALRAMGVRIAMDDFGTGYSSLSQLSSFPFDKIKIDRSFVSGKAQSDDRNAIVRAITALGASLGMATIAEGVETSEELARIRENGCTSVQGYLFSRPVPFDKVDDLIAQFTFLPTTSQAA